MCQKLPGKDGSWSFQMPSVAPAASHAPPRRAMNTQLRGRMRVSASQAAPFRLSDAAGPVTVTPSVPSASFALTHG
jgi:hypothetical protein